MTAEGLDPDTVKAQLTYLVMRYQSQRAAARAVGISQGMVSLILASYRNITVDVAAKIAAKYAETV